MIRWGDPRGGNLRCLDDETGEWLTWDGWRNKNLQRQFDAAIAEARKSFNRAAWELAHPARTPRDGYGWRGLVGTSYMPQPPTRAE